MSSEDSHQLLDIPDDANGLVAILSDLLQQNLDRDPSRRKLATASSSGTVSIRAVDIGLAVTIDFTRSGLKMRNGRDKAADIRVRADSMTLLELSAAPLRLGFPDIFDSQGRAMLRKLRTKELQVAGLLRHPLLLAKLNRLLSAT